jgi:hypothetical protein
VLLLSKPISISSSNRAMSSGPKRKGDVLTDLQLRLKDVETAICQHEQRLEELKRLQSELQGKIEEQRLEAKSSVDRFQINSPNRSTTSRKARGPIICETRDMVPQGDGANRQYSPVPHQPRKKKRQWQSVVRRKSETDDIWEQSNSKTSEALMGVPTDAVEAKGTQAIRQTADQDRGELGYVYQEVVRKKKERKRLPGHECDECRKFYKSIQLSDHMDPECKHARQRELCDAASRHRYRHKRPSTPPGYWDID